MNIRLKQAEIKDFDGFLAIRSEANNVYWSGFSTAPRSETLRQHFINAINSETRNFYLLFMDELVIGYLYIDYDCASNIAEVAYGVSEHFSGKGLAAKMIDMGMSSLPVDCKAVIAWIAESNVASTKSIERLGFIKSNESQLRTFAQEEQPLKFYKFIKNIGEHHD